MPATTVPCVSVAAQKETERRAGEGLRRGPTGGQPTCWHRPRLAARYSLPLGREICPWKYCRARYCSPATAKGVPPARAYFLGDSARERWRGVLVFATRKKGTGVFSDAAGPGADRRVPAAVRVQDRERVSRARLAADSHEHAAARGEHFENAGVVRLKSDAPHRAGQSQFLEVAARAL